MTDIATPSSDNQQASDVTTSVESLITENIETWTAAIKRKSITGRGSSKKIELYGVKKLRELILELAVRGKLVQQDPNDEPASVLLERITAEKAQLVKDKKIKKPKKLPPISEDEIPFPLPNGWEFCRLENMCELITKGSSPKWQGVSYTDNPQDVLFVTSENVGAFELLLSKRKYVEKKFNEIEPRSILKYNDFLMNIVGASIGRAALYNIEDLANINQAVCLIRSFPKLIYPSYFIFFFNSLTCISYMYDKQVENARPNLSMANISKFVIPIPPLTEQQRIVAKVDELMLLCDQLEQQTESSIDAHKTLVEVLLNTLTDSKNTAELQTNWARVSEFFDNLFTTEHSIDQLKQTILQLAVMGKLVPQDPNDEPAAKLLERIAEEKAQLIRDKKIKKQKALSPITEDEKPFELPNGWECERLGNLTSRLGSGSTPRGGQSAYVDEGIIFLRSQNVWNDGLKLDDTAYISDETHLKMSNTCVYPKDVLLNITGASLGRSTIFPAELVTANVSQHVTVIRLIDLNMCHFLHLGIQSPLVQKLVWGRQVGMAIEGLSKKVLEQFEFPVPPLKEQARIMNKVKELMAICDQLKSQLKQAQQTQLNLTDAIIDKTI
ncbi:restriction endonuclease subunit S [uncultured Psychromonas sp.]|uniref:restriction endonuclease subunit S n=1 Tax=uncultured Psychromonas sp. TaxID=173974 RepID=UPI002624A9F2|nr:restriction endonuclease subunit S [uncultured Psychromonas sp.]